MKQFRNFDYKLESYTDPRFSYLSTIREQRISNYLHQRDYSSQLGSGIHTRNLDFPHVELTNEQISKVLEPLDLTVEGDINRFAKQEILTPDELYNPHESYEPDEPDELQEMKGNGYSVGSGYTEQFVESQGSGYTQTVLPPEVKLKSKGSGLTGAPTKMPKEYRKKIKQKKDEENTNPASSLIEIVNKILHKS